ncbi:alpha/beta hydrolase [Bacillus sp. B15-48]|uniref:alpha/beta hydrolase n=1 Tax=Bacillus sp. B15-48 TaxID=1548601 RepID=UPI00193F4B05|nr:alpha/beta hydrolase [Bacillus sp. B15-48]MBM4761008.1 alpha/beta fold hydrolase [Bacillus sp. B15-48]
MVFIKKGCINIHYEWIKAENPHAKEVMVLIHAVGLDMHSWDLILPYLRPNYHILRYDLRGHGKSDAGIEKCTLDQLCDDLSFLIEELNISSFHLVCHGYGGFAGIQLAAKNVVNLQTLILMGVPVHYPKQLGDEIVKRQKDMTQGGKTMMPLVEEIVECICYPLTEEKGKILLRSCQQVSPDVYFDLFNTDDFYKSAKRLREITVPILILSGSEDALYPPELFCVSLNFNLDARYYTVPLASFMIQMDQPQLVAEWMIQFIDKKKPDRNYKIIDLDYQRQLTSQLYSEIRGLLRQDELEPPIYINELEVNIMNGFQVKINGKRIDSGWGKRKAKQLLLYLVFHRSATRDQLSDLLWPEVELENARNRLRVSIHYLKNLLETEKNQSSEILGTDREHLFLRANIRSDLVDYITAIKEAKGMEESEKKLERYKQLLIERTENAMPGIYEEWALNLQNWLEREWTEMALYLVTRYKQKKDENNAAYYFQIALSYDSSLEPLYPSST